MRVDSVAEEYAYLATWPPRDGPWERIGAGARSRPRRDRKTISRCARPMGRRPSSASPSAPSSARRRALPASPGERVRRRCAPGTSWRRRRARSTPATMPQYPVPSESHAGTVAVPLPILAVDAGQRGLLCAATHRGRALAVGGRRSASATRRASTPRAGRRRASAIGRRPRFATGTARGWRGRSSASRAIWGRLLDAWFSGERYPHLADEKREARLLLARLAAAGDARVLRRDQPALLGWLSGESQTP